MEIRIAWRLQTDVFGSWGMSPFSNNRDPEPRVSSEDDRTDGLRTDR